jgi:integrase/recombinase XerD
MRKTRKSTENIVRAMHARLTSQRGAQTTSGDDGLNRGDPSAMAHHYLQFLDYLRVRNYSPRTIENHRHSLLHFLTWCQDRDLYLPSAVTRAILESYQRWLFHLRQPNDRPLGIAAQKGRLGTLKTFFRWLCRERLIPHNPASELELPRSEKRLPQPALTLAQIESILALPVIQDPMGLRDRAIMETFFSSAIRRSELCRLQIQDLQPERHLLYVRQGKGKKDRVVPIGQRALHWVQRYLHHARPILDPTPTEQTLFLSAYGQPISPDHLSGLVTRYIQQAGLGPKGSCHLFRHSCATLMMENGADIRLIQEMLGHARIETTSIYTSVTVRQLQKIHSLTHPAESNPASEDK